MSLGPPLINPQQEITPVKNLLVHFGSVMVPILTSPSNCEGNSGRMPSTNTSHLTKTSVGFARKASHTPTSNNTLITLTLCDTNDINHLIFLEYSINRYLLLKEPIGKVDLLSNSPAIHLDLHQVSLLLLQPLHLPYLHEQSAIRLN
ncbi:large subunit ribosomal protein L3e [Striga asiatica]|uniref:Large subunit ribosomal protein L3e n=1 Tax=Striga asiatica TaxID=4170 RepID=A0A5A7PCK7_STRAF|nr:large subunit ribosomal protein L3e [Striga asiatica]